MTSTIGVISAFSKPTRRCLARSLKSNLGFGASSVGGIEASRDLTASRFSCTAFSTIASRFDVKSSRKACVIASSETMSMVSLPKPNASN